MGNQAVKKILVVYYSQTGQLKKIIDSVLSIVDETGIFIEYAEIKPIPAFPFPWGSDAFFQAFPESVKGIPFPFEPLKIQNNDHDLIVFAYQPWYLSPSIPAHSFLQSEEARNIFYNKPVITIVGCRNMWVMAQEKIKQYLTKLNSELVGNIVLCDKAPNLISVISIVRWLVQGKKEKYLGVIPESGVSKIDIKTAKHFGVPITEAINNNDFDTLQSKLNSLGAVKIKPNLLFFEKNGSRLFSIWANFILKKGTYNDPKRVTLIRLFKYYLLFVLFIVSPIVGFFYSLMRPFIFIHIKKNIMYYSQNKVNSKFYD